MAKKPRLRPKPTEDELADMTPGQRLIYVDMEQKKEAFLAALEQCYTVWGACKAAGIGSRRTPYDWRENDEKFAKAWDDAIESAVDRLEQSMYEKALKGTDTIATIFMLKGGRPEKYKDRVANEHTGKGGGPIEVANVRDQLAAVLGGDEKPSSRKDKE